ncbi:MAG: glycerophosphodiester phosphodiesterase family protein [Steroidobacteraceae bacterium]
MKKTKKRWIILGAAALFCIAVYLFNASWWAPKPAGSPILIAQRGIAQVYDQRLVNDSSCVAQFIPLPTHDYIPNTLPSMRAAFDAGADVVEVDISSAADGEFVAWHDAGLECRTEGKGPVGRQTLGELQKLDVGYGYTADGGKTYPLRGKGVGMMPSLGDILSAFPGKRFLLQLKPGPRDTGRRMVEYLDARNADWSKLSFFGQDGFLVEIKRAHPEVYVWSQKTASRCSIDYLLKGWTGHVPTSCRNGTIMISLAQSWLVWGWPNRFAQRMQDNHVAILAIGGIDGLSGSSFWRVDSQADLTRAPKGITVQLWTDHIEVVAPLMRGE